MQIDLAQSPLVQTARHIATEVVTKHAADVDKESRFPAEAFAEFKKAKLLSAYVPAELGGAGCSISELAAMSEAIAKHCLSTAMIFSMHQIQVATLVHHAMTAPYFRNYLQQLVEKQNLIASITSEVGVGGEMRRSVCAVQQEGATFTLEKDATTISYGAQCDDLLVSARRSPTAAPNDQVLVLAPRIGSRLDQKGTWDTLGGRGTCSPPFLFSTRGSVDQIMEVPFSESSAMTMVPVSHLLWSSAWLGLASAAVGKTHAFVRQQARATPGKTPPIAIRLADTTTKLQAMRATVKDSLGEYERLLASPDKGAGDLNSMGYAAKINNLKVWASRMVVEISQESLITCGVAGFKNSSPYSLAQIVRDALSAPLQIGNDRILATNASLLLVLKND